MLRDQSPDPRCHKGVSNYRKVPDTELFGAGQQFAWAQRDEPSTLIESARALAGGLQP